MSNTDTQLDGKPWYASKTVWGAIVAALAPVVGLALKVQINPDDAAAIAAALSGIGGVVAIYGRFAATGPIKK